MTASLSENVENWPDDPHSILGVDRTAGKSEVRTAYSALIRHFRPETYPREFQRIREAYELLLASLRSPESRSMSRMEAPANRDSASVQSEMAPLGPHAGSKFPGPVSLPLGQLEPQTEPEHGRLAPERRVVEIWKEFSDKPNPAHYAELRQICSSDHTLSSAFLGCYWMLRLCPEFDVRRRPAEWLIQGLPGSSRDARFVDLLAGEMQRDPRSTETAEFDSVTTSVSDPRLLVSWLQSRWALIARKNAWSRLSAEMEQVRSRLAFDHSAAWRYLLLHVWRIAAYSRKVEGRVFRQSLERELNDHHLNSALQGSDLQLVDLLTAMAEQRVAGTGNQILDQLLQRGYLLDAREFRDLLLQLAVDWMAKPDKALETLTFVSVKYREAFLMFCHQAESFGLFDRNETSTDPVPNAMVLGLLTDCIAAGYEKSRGMVASFCRDQCLSGQEFCRCLLAHVDNFPAVVGLSDVIRKDLPLMLVCQLLSAFLRSSAMTAQDDILMSATWN